jgi:hypothetical protein
VYTVDTFGDFPRPRQKWRGILFLCIEPPERFAHATLIGLIERAKFRVQAPIIDRPRLVQRCVHSSVFLFELNEPRTRFWLRGRGNNKIEAVRKFLEDNHRPRKLVVLAVDLRADVLADARPPNVPLRDQRRLVRSPRLCVWKMVIRNPLGSGEFGGTSRRLIH